MKTTTESSLPEISLSTRPRQAEIILRKGKRRGEIIDEIITPLRRKASAFRPGMKGVLGFSRESLDLQCIV